MKIVLAVSSHDIHLLEAQTQVNEYHGGLDGYDIFLAPSNEVKRTVEDQYLDRYQMLGKSASILNIQYNEVGSWPHGPNKHWCHTVYALDAMKNRDCWLWYEMDMWGLVPWAKALEDEYLKGGKRCLGRIVPTPHRDASDRIFYKEDEEMMMGCAIYPAQMTSVPEFQAIAQGLINGPVTALANVRTDPFDLKLRGFFKKAGWTASKAIGDRWNTRNYRVEEGKLVCDSGEPRFKDMAHHDTDISGAILIHGCKDDSLAKLILSGHFDGQRMPATALQKIVTATPQYNCPPPPPPAQGPPSLVLLQGLAGRTVKPEEHANFLHNLDILMGVSLSVSQAEAPKTETLVETETGNSGAGEGQDSSGIHCASTPEGKEDQIGLILGKVQAILATGDNIRLGALSKAVEVPKDELRAILKANGYTLGGVSQWVKKAA